MFFSKDTERVKNQKAEPRNVISIFCGYPRILSWGSKRNEFETTATKLAILSYSVMPTNKPKIGPSKVPTVSLTRFLTLHSIRAAWKSYFPGTTTYVSSLNRAFKSHRLIPPDQWVQQHSRYSTVGTAYDYLVGVMIGNDSLHSPLERAERVVSNSPELAKRFILLRRLLETEIPKVREGSGEEDAFDFYRGLGALADLDAMFRSLLVPLPEWITSSQVVGLPSLRLVIRRNYPTQFVRELQQLCAVTVRDLPVCSTVVYNPVFGGLSKIPLAADGDFILDDLLLELKVSVNLFKGNHLWQLLGYVALDHLKGENRIKRVGLYNPRYRAFWTESVEVLITQIGGKTFGSFCVWFRKNASPSNVRQAIVQDREKY